MIDGTCDSGTEQWRFLKAACLTSATSLHFNQHARTSFAYSVFDVHPRATQTWDKHSIAPLTREVLLHTMLRLTTMATSGGSVWWAVQHEMREDQPRAL